MICIIIPPKISDPSKHSILSRFTSMIRDAQIYRETSSTLKKPLPAVIPAVTPALQALIIIGTIVAFNGAMLALVNQIRLEFLELITTMPNFEFAVNNEGQETGNFSFVLYSLLRDAALYFFIFVFMIFGILLMLKQAELVTTETLKNMLKTSMIGVIIIMIFPYIWDPISDMSEGAAVWMLNPLYTGDKDNPCLTETNNYLIAELYAHQRNMSEFASVGGIYADDEPCNPNLRINYLFAKAVFGASEDIDIEPDWWNFIDTINAWFQTGTESIFSAMFLSVTKVSILFFLTTFAALLGSVRQLLTDVVAISLPILLVFRSLPFWGIDKMANTLLAIFVPLIFVPFFTALIITAGSTSLMTQEVDLTTITLEERNAGVIDTLARDRYMFWLYAIATLTLAVLTPVLFVPMLSSISGTIGTMIQTGIQSGVMSMAGMATGAAAGATSTTQGMMAGSTSTGTSLSSIMVSRGGMSTMIKGMAQGMISEGSHGKITPGGPSGYEKGYQLAEQRAHTIEAARRIGAGGVFAKAGSVPPITHGTSPFDVTPVAIPAQSTAGDTSSGTSSTHGRSNLGAFGFSTGISPNRMPSYSYAPLGTSPEHIQTKEITATTGITDPKSIIHESHVSDLPRANPDRKWLQDIAPLGTAGLEMQRDLAHQRIHQLDGSSNEAFLRYDTSSPNKRTVGIKSKSMPEKLWKNLSLNEQFVTDRPVDTDSHNKQEQNSDGKKIIERNREYKGKRDK